MSEWPRLNQFSHHVTLPAALVAQRKSEEYFHRLLAESPVLDIKMVQEIRRGAVESRTALLQKEVLDSSTVAASEGKQIVEISEQLTVVVKVEDRIQ